jgi:hypothetical protein
LRKRRWCATLSGGQVIGTRGRAGFGSFTRRFFGNALTSPVMLSVAKNLHAGRRELLRCAQHDSSHFPCSIPKNLLVKGTPLPGNWKDGDPLLFHRRSKFQLDAIGIAEAEDGNPEGWQVSHLSMLHTVLLEKGSGFFEFGAIGYAKAQMI